MGDNEESELIRLFWRLDGKIDRIVDQAGTTVERVASHDARLLAVERDIGELKAAKQGDRAVETTGRQALIASICGGVAGSLVAVVATLLSHH